MNCPSCDRSLPDDAAFCGYCGSTLRPEQICSSCGRSSSADMRFCLGCGAGLAEAPEPRAPDPLSYTPKFLFTEMGATGHAELEEMLDRVNVLLQVTDAQSRLPRIALVRADLAHASGDEAARTAELREAHRLFTEMGATGHAERLAREIDS